MKYLCLVYLDEEHWNACPDEVCFAYGEQLRESLHLLAAEPLHPVNRATTVRVRNGQTALFDGPFAETKEQLLGFVMVEADTLDEALDIAAGIPLAELGTIEVRAIYDIPGS